MHLLHRLRDRLQGPPPALPGRLDDLAEAWWRLPPRVRAVLVAAAALAVLLLAGAGATRSPWGGTVRVPVAARDLPPGVELSATDVRWRDWPAALAPEPVAPVGEVLAVGLVRDALIRPDHFLVPGAAGGIGDDEAVVVLDAATLPAAARGQRIDLLAGGYDGTGRVLARAARVVAVDDGRVWVAVARADAPAVAGAAAAGSVTGALLPPR